MSARPIIPCPVRPGATARRDRTVPSDESAYALKIAAVYQDSVTRNWAQQMCRAVTQRVGEEWVQNTWHQVSDLSDPGILRDAVQTALRADVIVVSIRAVDELPVELCAWIDAWLARRPPRVGALAALIGVAEQLGPQAVRTQEYLQAVARRGQLDFVPHERTLPN
jgi:hypothetical protein